MGPVVNPASARPSLQLANCLVAKDFQLEPAARAGKKLPFASDYSVLMTQSDPPAPGT